jgi:alginate O-acetyltransferase complex protein AlgI
MLFNSIEFLIFFVIAATLYFFIPHRFRWVFLLLASYYFYMCWNPVYIILLIISTLIDYFAGLMMGKTADKKRRRKYLIISLCSNLGLLFAFKYFNFLNGALKVLLDSASMSWNIGSLNVLLPVGISFYTFQSLSYGFDVYRGAKAPEKHVGIFALYISFFPQLVAGPIERSTRLLPQFYNKIKFNYERATDGLLLMLWGFFKKVVIADRVAAMVDQVYNNVYDYQGLAFIIATLLFAFQIYCDFSGYSDIAIGAARIMGFDLMANFRTPYYAKSISEFWKRWHISLTSWFKDYLYISLGGNRVVKWRWYYNIMIVFVISGFWHGANWTFLIWGALNGFYLLFSIWTAGFREKIARFIHLDKLPNLQALSKVLITFALVCFAWIFFRANNINDAFYVITHLFTGMFNEETLMFVCSGFGFGTRGLVIALAAICLMETVQLVQQRRSIKDVLAKKPTAIRLALYVGLIVCIIMLGKFSANQFIYFQF